MTVERRYVLVGIRMDGHSRQLLNWALVKVAEPHDSVIALHVVRSADYVSKRKLLVEGYFDVYKGLCDVKKVGLSCQILTGSSFRNILVREAKNCAAMALVVGGGASTAKYCAKRLPPTTNVLAIQGAKIVFRRFTDEKLPGGLIEDPRPSLSTVVFSEFGDSKVESEKLTRDDSRELEEDAYKGAQSCMKVLGDPSEQKLGWPLLHRAYTEISQTHHVRDMPVVQWVMSLPNRSPKKNQHCSTIDDNSSERGINDNEDESYKKISAPSVELPKSLERVLNVNTFSCRWFSIEVLKSCTCQFSSENLIGKGGSNRVYKGILPDGKPIAVKVLQSSKVALKDFAREVEIISSLKHKSITPLLGICVDDSAFISVYDYCPKGSLEENLHGKTEDGSFLSWEVRFNVAVGIAEALNFLHNETSKPIIHRDVKSSNILLSYGFEPQLSDFGLAIRGPTTSSFMTHNDVVGTFGYLAPEYFMYGKVSDKIDVYAFGVVLLELISGREPISSETCNGQESLVAWAKPILESGDVEGLLDPNLQEKFDEAQMQKMVLAASLCIRRAARLRPTLNQILNILKGYDGKVENFFNAYQNDSENQENIDDEVYPNSSADLHLSLALLDVDYDTASNSSTVTTEHTMMNI
ncbi:serine/threonine-protein kinase CDG1-like [Abrus precatorius]|uniref:Serine/threonine-protein kinase CDG1-like n=1 Tax=Abrus precatorius TaxID=3816 RepID=A0A8B8LQD1_ABRPR|nr:serine/threonine-protein kinase CDG1-like [Abrus precatorius]